MLATALARELPRFDVALIQARSASEGISGVLWCTCLRCELVLKTSCVFNFPANLKEN